VEDHVVVRFELSTPVTHRVVGDRLRILLARCLDSKGAGHAEMHQECRAVVELGQQILAATAQRRDPMALQTRGESRREREAQVAPTQLDALDHRPLERRQEPTPDGLDLGKLGHRSTRRPGVNRLRRLDVVRLRHRDVDLSVFGERVIGVAVEPAFAFSAAAMTG
jgi:hypothetical protein